MKFFRTAVFAALILLFRVGTADAAIDMSRFRRAARDLNSSRTTEITSDSRCPEGEYKNGGECSPCAFVLPNCLQCLSGSLCTVCADGYERTESGKCSKTGCDDVVVNGKKHIRNKRNGICSFQCQNGENCASCDMEGFCTACADGYTLSPDKLRCVDCSENCADCDVKTQCLLCNEGYTLIQGRCFAGTIMCPPETRQDETGCCVIR